MNKKRVQLSKLQTKITGYDSILAEAVKSAENSTARCSKGGQRHYGDCLLAYWSADCEWEQGGETRANYGQALLKNLAFDLGEDLWAWFL